MQQFLENLEITGPMLIIFASALWAFDGIVRLGFSGIRPLHIVFFEYLVGSLLLLPLGAVFLDQTKLSKKEWGLMVLVSLLGFFGTFFFTAAVLRTGAVSFSVVYLILKLQPIFAVGTATGFLKEKISRSYLAYGFLALVAAYFVTFPYGHVNFITGGTAIAALFAFIAAAACGSSTTFSKIVLLNQNSTLVTALRFWMTTAIVFIAILVTGTLPQLALPTASQSFRFLLVALSTGMAAILIYYRGLRTTPVRVAAILQLVFPLAVVLIDLFFFHTVLAWTQYAAGVVLIFAMYRITGLENKKEQD